MRSAMRTEWIASKTFRVQVLWSHGVFQKISRTSLEPPDKVIRDGIKLAQLVIARDCQSLGHWFDSVKTPKKKNENSDLHRFELHRP